MDPIAGTIAQASTGLATANVQQSVQLSMLKRGQDNDAATEAKILASTAQSGGRSSAPDIGTMIDVNA